jgi:replicative DNA helicase
MQRTQDKEMPSNAIVIRSPGLNRMELAERLLCMMSGVSSHKVRRGLVSDEEYKRLTVACSDLSALPVYIEDN